MAENSLYGICGEISIWCDVAGICTDYSRRELDSGYTFCFAPCNSKDWAIGTLNVAIWNNFANISLYFSTLFDSVVNEQLFFEIEMEIGTEWLV